MATLQDHMNRHNGAETFWDVVAKYFDRIKAKDTPINAAIIEKAKHYLSRSDTILDVGCGSGTAVLALASSVREVRGIGLIPSLISYAAPELERVMGDNGHEIVESNCLHRSGRQQLIVARKSE